MDNNELQEKIKILEQELNETKKIVFRTRDANSSINIMKLTSCWIDKQERPLCFQISSFTSSRIKTEEEKIRPS